MQVGPAAHERHGLGVGVVGRGHPARELVPAVAAPQEPAVGASAVELAGRRVGFSSLRGGDYPVPVGCDVVYVVEMCHVKTLMHS